MREQHEREDEQRGVGDQHEPAAVVGVGERAAEQRGEEQRHDLRQPDQADQQRRAREVVDLERHRDVRQHRAGERDRLPDEEQAEVAVPPQRADVDGEARGEAAEARHVGGQRTRRPLRPASPPGSLPQHDRLARSPGSRPLGRARASAPASSPRPASSPAAGSAASPTSATARRSRSGSAAATSRSRSARCARSGAGRGAGPWLRAGIVADAADLVAHAPGPRQLPPLARAGRRRRSPAARAARRLAAGRAD